MLSYVNDVESFAQLHFGENTRYLSKILDGKMFVLYGEINKVDWVKIYSNYEHNNVGGFWVYSKQNNANIYVNQLKSQYFLDCQVVWNNPALSNIYECFMTELNGGVELVLSQVTPANQAYLKLNNLQSSKFFIYFTFAQTVGSAIMTTDQLKYIKWLL